MCPAGKALPEAADAICIAGPGEKVLRDFQVLVQKVGGRPEVLLIGETLEGQDIHSMMSTFVNDVFSSTCQPVHPGDLLKEPPSNAMCTVGSSPCQLIFFLCRAGCMANKQAELQKVLKEVKKYVQKTPCALVGIIMDAKPSEAEAARAQLLRLLRGVFAKKAPHKKDKADGSAKDKQSKTGPTELEDVEVEAEIYIPGQPRGRLAVMRAACRASEALIKSRGLPEDTPKDSLTRSKDPLPLSGSWLWTIFKTFLLVAIIASLALAAWYMTEGGTHLPSFTMPKFFTMPDFTMPSFITRGLHQFF